MNYVTRYSEYRKFRPMTKRERLRYLALEMLSHFSKRNGTAESHVVFLAFHFMFEDNEGLFRELLEILASEYKFLTVSEAVDQVNEGRLVGKNLCFTCDDGFMSCKRAGEILAEFGASCCFFLCPSFINSRSVGAVANMNEIRLGGPPIEFLDWNDIDGLLSFGHEIGNHTFSHVNLARVSEEVAHFEIENAHFALESLFGKIRHFACPYGHPKAYTPQSMKIVQNLSYQSFFTTTRGKHYNLDRQGGLLFNRQHFEPFWPVNQSCYFLD